MNHEFPIGSFFLISDISNGIVKDLPLKFRHGNEDALRSEIL
jgi:hypothetical protein